MIQTRYTRKLAEHCASIRFNGLSSEVIQYTGFLMLDFLGLAPKGLSLESTQQIHSLIRKIGGKGNGTVIGTTLRTLPQYAALANATASHSLSLDDIYTPASIHPGSAIFAASLAVAESVGADGERFIEGVVAGYETTLRIADAVGSKEHYALGWHPTATCGTFGATVAVSRIIGLDPNKTTNALGIAGSMASGSMEFLEDGSWTKRIHPGLAAQRGIQAALLANEGFRGPRAILEGRWGFLRGTSRDPEPFRLVEGLGGRLRILDTGIKLHACCRYNQSPIDAILNLKKEYDLSPKEIDRIRVEIFRAAFPLVVDPWEEKMNPKSDVQAQFSLPYTVAAAIVRDRVSFEEFLPESLSDSSIREVMEKVEVVHDPELDPAFPRSWPARVKLGTRDGKHLENRVDFPRGDVNNPLSWNELVIRFKEHSKEIFDPTLQDGIVETLQRIQELKDMKKLTDLLRIKGGD
jgi:2-methylcitrate dehydratase PrpD